MRGTFDKFKDVLYKDNDVPEDVALLLLREDLEANTILWGPELRFPAITVVVPNEPNTQDLDDETLLDEFRYFVDDEKIDVISEYEYFNLFQGIAMTVFQVSPKTSMIKLKFQWDLKRVKEREERNA